MHPRGAIKNKLAQATFSKDGPNLISPAVTNKPKVIPNIYNDKSNKYNGNPSSNIDMLNNGIAMKTAGTKPNKVLRRAVEVKAQITSLDLNGDTKRLIKFLLHISSRKSML